MFFFGSEGQLMCIIMIYLGIALMIYNIYKYVMFARLMRSRGDWKRERRIFNIPVLLLVLFLAGYIAVSIFGTPDIIISSGLELSINLRQ